MSESLAERVARIEVQNEQCGDERKEHATELDSMKKVLNQAVGAIRMLTVLWAIATGVGALGWAKGFLHF